MAANVSAPQVAQVCNRDLKGNRTAFVVLRSVDGHRPADVNRQAATRNVQPPKLDGDKQSGKRGDHVGDRSNDKQQAKSRHFLLSFVKPLRMDWMRRSKIVINLTTAKALGLDLPLTLLRSRRLGDRVSAFCCGA
jgi:hypothetical protein